jgi:hypothetical protein
MRIFQKQKAHDLQAWLRITTMGLAAPAKERIRLEVEAHHADAVAAHLQEGLSESDAQSAALIELGDADEAANCFRKQHLTVREAEQVKEAVRQLGSRLSLLGNYILFFACFSLILNHGWFFRRNILVLLSVWFMAAIVIPAFNFFKMRRKSKNLGNFVLMQRMAWCVNFVCLIYFIESGYHLNMWRLFSVFIIVLIPVFRICLKLRHVANVWDEIPPQNDPWSS